jgi:acyl-coenzyme A thioesterase PaaI-like protein
MLEQSTAALSLQERYAPGNVCYGCGPANPAGIHIRSFPKGDEVVCDWTPEPHHHGYPGALNGGIIGTLFDCHCNWTATYHLMQKLGLDRPLPTVTADYSVKFHHPTPMGPLTVRARVVHATDDRATVEATLEAGGQVCATERGTFVAVKPGHPAYDRW